MKLQFKHQAFQLEAVDAVVNLFQGQVRQEGLSYMADPGRSSQGELDLLVRSFRNAPISLSPEAVHQAIKATQIRYGIKPSEQLSISRHEGARPAYRLTVEMETGTGKTYTYIRTIMELNKRYGWLKFIIVVPSIAIREGVKKSFEVTAEHFKMDYGKVARFFVYDSSRLGDLDTFANSSDIRVMIINTQAFNARGEAARRIHAEQESFRWRKPIDVIAATHPILIIDEPQSVEGAQTLKSLEEFKPMLTIGYSATHKTPYDMVYRLDATDAYNQQLVKKIAVKTIEQSQQTGTSGYLYLQNLLPQKSGKPKARIEFECRTASGVTKKTRVVEEGFDLYHESGKLEAYAAWILTDFDMRDGQEFIQVGANRKLCVGEVWGQEDEEGLRALQIRETIKSHLETEEKLYPRGIKVLSLFFIDQVAKYKCYDDQHNPYNGNYAQVFEEEYHKQVQAYLKAHEGASSPYVTYLKGQLEASRVHAGYFSVDKVKKSDKTMFVDLSERQSNKEKAQEAYDLIMKDKERLLSLEEPVRFIFSHSALKEGWDNPNVFQICTLKQSSAETRKRQEIGRGMRLAVDRHGIRQDKELLGADVHDINKLTVIANESYESFTRALQSELSELLSNRPRKVTVAFLVGNRLQDTGGKEVVLDEDLARKLYNDLVKQDYISADGLLTDTYYEHKDLGSLQLSEDLQGLVSDLVPLLDKLYDPKAYQVEHANLSRIRMGDTVNQENLAKQEFQDLWARINRKTSYRVRFDDEELIDKAIEAINQKLRVTNPTYQISQSSADQMTEEGLAFERDSNRSHYERLEGPLITVSYDLLGEVAEVTGLKRQTVAAILNRIDPEQFDGFKVNPEDFILKVGRLINETKSRQIISHIEYHLLDETYSTSVFADNEVTLSALDLETSKSHKGIYHYCKVDSSTEAKFKDDLESQEDVKVYVKLPNAFKISTPVGDYNPDWAIAFKEGSVKHVYFVAETKGSLSSLELRETEKAKIDCAKAHFKALQASGVLENGAVYDVVSNYQDLLALVQD